MSDSAKKIIIIGAGGFAREVYGYLEDLRKAGARLEMVLPISGCLFYMIRLWLRFLCTMNISVLLAMS